MRARIAAAVLLPWIATCAAAVDKPDLERVEELVIARTNDFRHEEGLQRLEPSGKLDETARRFAEYMASTDRFGHRADGKAPWERAQRSGYRWCAFYENIAYRFSSIGFRTRELAESLVEGWKESPGHRRNMLQRGVVDTGVGVARSEKTGRYYAVQLFGRARSPGC